MLQIAKSIPAADREEQASVAATVRRVLGLARRQYLAVTLALMITCSIGVVYLVMTPPSYTARARLLLDTRKFQVFQQQQQVLGDMGVDTAAIESQVEILKSQNIATAVVKEQHLLDDPKFTTPGGGLFDPIYAAVFGHGGKSPSQTEVNERAVRAFMSNLDVRRIGLTYVIEISYRSNEPDFAAKMANAVADAYIVDQLDAKFLATKRASSWLQDRITELRIQAAAAARAVVDFKTKNNIVSADGKLIDEQQVAELSSALVGSRAKISEAQARVDRIEAILRSPDEALTGDSATVADTLNNTIVTRLRSQYLDMVNREAEWRVKYGPNHLAVVNLRNQMQGILGSIREELRRLAETYKSDLEIAKQREQGLQKDLATAVSQSQITDQVKISLRELESNANTYRSLYESFLQRYMETTQQQTIPITEARLISDASRPSFRSSPQARVVLAYSLISGLALGIAFGWWREFRDRVFRTRAQLESALDRECIAVLPLVNSLPARSRDGRAPAAPNGSRIITRDRGVTWTAIDEPFSRFAEELRSIKLAIDVNRTAKAHNQIIGFTSTKPNEGKSTIAVSFARLAAQAGARVLLIDCDMRNPSLSRHLAPQTNAGLLDVLAGKSTLAEVTWKDSATTLTFLPVAMNSPVAHSNEILRSDVTKQLFERLRHEFDYVIVDLPPLLPIVDVRSSTAVVDSYVFVVEWGHTRMDIVEHALKSAKGIHDGTIGVVLNKANIRAMGKFEGYDSAYYYDKHYVRYGYTE